MIGDCDDDSYYDLSQDGNGMFLDGAYQVIKWQPYQATKWHTLADENGKEM